MLGVRAAVLQLLDVTARGKRAGQARVVVALLRPIGLRLIEDPWAVVAAGDLPLDAFVRVAHCRIPPTNRPPDDREPWHATTFARHGRARLSAHRRGNRAPSQHYRPS